MIIYKKTYGNCTFPPSNLTTLLFLLLAGDTKNPTILIIGVPKQHLRLDHQYYGGIQGIHAQDSKI